MRLVHVRKFEFLVCVASLTMLTYLGWQACYGARGYSYRDKLVVHLEGLKAEGAGILVQRQALEAKVKLVRPESIDPDFVDELARRDLFMVKPTDVIVAFSK